MAQLIAFRRLTRYQKSALMRSVESHHNGKPFEEILAETCAAAETVAEVAVKFGVHVCTVYRWCAYFGVTPPTVMETKQWKKIGRKSRRKPLNESETS